MKSVAVLLSGGVDSAVALHMLKEQGYAVHAFYLKIWLEDELSFLGDCPWEEDLSYVKKTTAALGVPLEILSLQREYHDTVVCYTIDQLKKGNTPNPDIFCNTWIKCGVFFDKYHSAFDYFATGHYAQWREGYFCCSVDPIKDQTYFLAYTPYDRLQRYLFPLGVYKKTEIRAYAQRYMLPSAERKDSQGICFLGKISFQEFVAYHCGKKEGNLIEAETGAIKGVHQGHWFYTVGQRGNIGLSGGPWYVVRKEEERNEVVISKQYYDQEKIRKNVTVTKWNWLVTENDPLREKFFTEQPVAVKLRHGPFFHRGVLQSRSCDTYTLALEQNDQGIAKGQSAVWYDEKETICLGSGIIC